MDRGELKIFAPPSSSDFAESICKYINERYSKSLSLGSSRVNYYTEDEFKPELLESVRGKDVYVVQRVQNPASDFKESQLTLESLLFVNAVATSRAAHTTLVWPYFPYSRQDRRDGKTPRSAKAMADFIVASGADGLITCDIHAEQIENAFNPDFGYDNIKGSNKLIPFLKENYSDFLSDAMVCSPDAGGARRARFYARTLETGIEIFTKIKDKEGIEMYYISPLVKGKNLIIVDDMASTCGTIKTAITNAEKQGAKGALVVVTHPLLNYNEKEGKSAEQILSGLYDNGKGLLKGVIALNTISHGEEFEKRNESWFKSISSEDLFGKAISRKNRDESMGNLLK